MRKTSKKDAGKNRRKAALVNRRKEKSPLQIWGEREIDILKEQQEDGYGCACSDSALKAFISLCQDGHSGCSIRVTQNILNRLIDGKPLTPIEDTEDAWHNVTDYGMGSDYKTYQCKRCSALFKDVYNDGHVEYHYNDQCYCVDINNENNTYHSSLASRIIREMYPITMPFMPPNKPIKVVCEDFLTDKKNGDFDTVGIYEAILPDGNKAYINRWFKESKDGWEEINDAEYQERKAARING